MKPTLLTTLSFLLFALTTNFPLAFTQGWDYVYDTDGKPLVAGDKYYLLQTNTSGQKGGGLMLGYSGVGQTCPLTPLQPFCEFNEGLPVRFKVGPGSSGVIVEDELNIEIEFYDKPKCAHSSKWVVVENFANFHMPWISIGSSEDHGSNILEGVFKIKKQKLGYKFYFFVESQRTVYGIDRFNDVNARRLVANAYSQQPHPFIVEFVNANRHGRSVV